MSWWPFRPAYEFASEDQRKDLSRTLLVTAIAMFAVALLAGSALVWAVIEAMS